MNLHPGCICTHSGFASPLGRKKMQQSSQVEVFKKIFGQGYSGDAKKKKILAAVPVTSEGSLFSYEKKIITFRLQASSKSQTVHREY